MKYYIIEAMPKKQNRYSELLSQISAVYEAGMRDLSDESRNERTLTMYWQMGRHIVEMEQEGRTRAAYGKQLLTRLSTDLIRKYGSGFSRSNVAYMRQFYSEYEIVHPGGQLSWSHYKALMTVKSPQDRASLEKRVMEEGLSKTALLALVRQMNGVGATALREALTPRKGRFDILKVVQVAEGKKKRLALDCGFRVLARMPRRRSPRLQPGEYVASTGTGEASSVKRTTCRPGERYCYRGYLQRVVDGDTVEAVLNLPLGGATQQRLRLRGVNAAELGTAAGEEARQAVTDKCGPGDALKVLTYHHDVHGRYVADVFLDGARFLNMDLIEYL